jgi:hypothetical protein
MSGNLAFGVRSVIAGTFRFGSLGIQAGSRDASAGVATASSSFLNGLSWRGIERWKFGLLKIQRRGKTNEKTQKGSQAASEEKREGNEYYVEREEKRHANLPVLARNRKAVP